MKATAMKPLAGMRAEQFKFQELFYTDQPDTDAIRSQYKKLAELRQR